MGKASKIVDKTRKNVKNFEKPLKGRKNLHKYRKTLKKP